jgi:hypothetical protein
MSVTVLNVPYMPTVTAEPADRMPVIITRVAVHFTVNNDAIYRMFGNNFCPVIAMKANIAIEHLGSGWLRVSSRFKLTARAANIQELAFSVTVLVKPFVDFNMALYMLSVKDLVLGFLSRYVSIKTR